MTAMTIKMVTEIVYEAANHRRSASKQTDSIPLQIDFGSDGQAPRLQFEMMFLPAWIRPIPLVSFQKPLQHLALEIIGSPSSAALANSGLALIAMNAADHAPALGGRGGLKATVTIRGQALAPGPGAQAPFPGPGPRAP